MLSASMSAAPIDGKNRFGQASKWRCPGMPAPEPVHVSADSRFCRWCQKRFARETVFVAHLTGKKHIKALEAGGQAAEAAAIRQKLAVQKMSADSKQALEDAKDAQEETEKKRKHEHGEVRGLVNCAMWGRASCSICAPRGVAGVW